MCVAATGVSVAGCVCVQGAHGVHWRASDEPAQNRLLVSKTRSVVALVKRRKLGSTGGQTGGLCACTMV